MFRNILVTLDGSAYSEAILPVVADLAAGSAAVVTLFTADQLPSATVEMPIDVPVVLRTAGVYTRAAVSPRYDETRTQAIERRERELKEYVEEKAKLLRQRGINVHVAVALGDDAGQLIIDYARQHPVDLIAMSSHGHTGLRSLIFGGVAGKVLASGVRPVLMVRPRDLAHRPE